MLVPRRVEVETGDEDVRLNELCVINKKIKTGHGKVAMALVGWWVGMVQNQEIRTSFFLGFLVDIVNLYPVSFLHGWSLLSEQQ